MGVQIREKPKGSGVYWLFINHQGKRKSKKIGKDESLANEVAEKIKAKLLLGELKVENINKTSPAFEPYAKTWLALPHDWKESTRDEYRRKLRLHVFPVIGKLQVDEIDKKCLQSLFDGLAIKGLSHSTIAVIRAATSEILQHAFDGDLIDRNPLRDLKFKGKKKKYIVKPLTEEESALLLEKAADYKNGEYHPMMLTALRTGMRSGEMIALKWSDIDFNERSIEVKRSYVKKRFTTPKNHKSRFVDMSLQLAQVLKDLRTDQKSGRSKKVNRSPNLYLQPVKANSNLGKICGTRWRNALKPPGSDAFGSMICGIVTQPSGFQRAIISAT